MHRVAGTRCAAASLRFAHMVASANAAATSSSTVPAVASQPITPIRYTPAQRSVVSIGKTQGRLVIIGSGWAGFKLVRNIDAANYEAVGTLEFRAIVEPVRQFHKPLQFHQARVGAIDLDRQTITCTSCLEDNQDTFTLPYDKLVIAPGAVSNTFGIEGVEEHAVFLKEIADARRIRARVIECFEHAMQPGVTEDEQLRLLHFQIAGAGPTGVEFSAELHDFITEDLKKLYPSLMPKVQMTLFDMAPRILGGFDASLSEIATRRFTRNGVKIRTGTRITKVEKGCITVNDGERVPFGLLVWGTGITQTPLVKSLYPKLLAEDRGLRRLVTDPTLRVLRQDGTPIDNVFALGDCATIKDLDLPATAQVANQKANYLAKQLNHVDKPHAPFTYHHMGTMAYIGGWRAVADLSKDVKPTGFAAWVFWRSAYLSMSVGWRNKALIPMFWFLAWAFGRDTSRIQ
ncbi:hypothetical protein H9P43_006128 [Blastocladiella emersonii ATCC 22665]|nr:hypothetical protein H9P43_006128 [Blastocladiella emersonii ATCC 22665]